MKRTRFLWATGAIFVFGAGMPGCLWSGDPSKGRICAAPAEGGEHCVPATYDPAGAWEKADAHGKLPIQMWAERPEEMTLDELVKSRDNLNRWLADVDKALGYVRETQRNAESYRASLDGKLGIRMREAKARQGALLKEEAVDAVGRFKVGLAQSAEKERGPLVAKLAEDKQSLTQVEAIFEGAKEELGPHAAAYAKLVNDFAVYRATESAEAETASSFATEASGAAVDALEKLEPAILKAAHEASSKPNGLRLAALKLAAEIQQVELAARESLEPHADFIAARAANPDMTSAALRSIHAMLGYIDARVRRSDATATFLLFGVSTRRQALLLLENASEGARKAFVEERLAKAASIFEAAVEETLDGLGEAAPSGVDPGLPYLARRYDKLAAVAQMQPLCDPGTSAWREAGCAAIRDQFKVATAELQAMPAKIEAGLSAMRDRGVDPAAIDAVKKKLDSGDVKGAAIAHDALVRGLEEVGQ
jgi:hypothetical protein